MQPWLTTQWGNASSIHAPGRAARRAIEQARRQVADWLGARPEQVIFTSGATEANNSAIHSALLQNPSKRHIVTSLVEHSAVLAYCKYLEKHWHVDVTYLGVDSNGKLCLEELESAIRDDTALVSLMWANNETGVIWPIHEIALICNQKGVPLHTDAVQAAGKISVDFASCGTSFLSLSGHKFGSPKGIGALLIAEPASFVPMMHGGKQEMGLRGGTENLSHIVGLGAAAQIAASQDEKYSAKVRELRDTLEIKIIESIEVSSVNGFGAPRLPNTSHIHIPGIDADALVTYLDQQGICVSSGSACLESAITPSHVILAMTDSHDRASESIRISLGGKTTHDDLHRTIERIQDYTRISKNTI